MKIVLVVEGESEGLFEEFLKTYLRSFCGLDVDTPATPLGWERFFRKRGGLAVVRAGDAADVTDNLARCCIAVPPGTVFARVSDVHVWRTGGSVPEKRAIHEIEEYERRAQELIEEAREESLQSSRHVFLRAARELWFRGLEVTPVLLADAVELLADGEDSAVRSRLRTAASALKDALPRC